MALQDDIAALADKVAAGVAEAQTEFQTLIGEVQQLLNSNVQPAGSVTLSADDVAAVQARLTSMSGAMDTLHASVVSAEQTPPAPAPAPSPSPAPAPAPAPSP